MTSEILTTQQKQDQVRGWLNAANIPPAFWNMTPAKLGEPACTMVNNYIMKDYPAEKLAGRGLILSGPAPIRAKMFVSLARTLVLQTDAVYFTSLHGFLEAFEFENGKRYEDIIKCQALFVFGFYDKALDFPYDGYKRGKIEQALYMHSSSGRRLYLSSDMPLATIKWWSADFKQMLSAFVQELPCPLK